MSEERTPDEVYCRIINLLLSRGVDEWGDGFGWRDHIRAMRLTPERRRLLAQAEKIGRQRGTLIGGYRHGFLRLSDRVIEAVYEIEAMTSDPQPWSSE